MRISTKTIPGAIVAITMAVAAATANAQEGEVRLTPDKAHVDVKVGNQGFRIERNQDQNHEITGAFAKTSRKCPPFCIQPRNVAPGVTTVAELEFFDFIEKKVNTGRGLVIDARTPSWYQRGTIPGSVNIPFTVFGKASGDLELIEAMELVGARQMAAESSSGFSLAKALSAMGISGDAAGGDEIRWDFSRAKELLLWCNGPWCGQSPRAIRNLLDLGYPASKLYYYRGGMQMWQMLGLTTVVPE
ncbi:MAG: rhodanese-like domain-containing protein [Gammaproteobacteria bacterium]